MSSSLPHRSGHDAAGGDQSSDEPFDNSEFVTVWDDETGMAAGYLSQKKWGFIVYRWDYLDDKKWANFMSTFESVARLQVEPRLQGSLVFDQRDDRTMFDNASIDDIRKHFNAWATSSTIIEELVDGTQGPTQGAESSDVNMPRYTHFILVDNATMDRVLEHRNDYKDRYPYYAGWVSLVDACKARHTDERIREGTDRNTHRVTPTQLYPAWYTESAKDLFGVDWTRLHAPLVWIGDREGFWPEKGKTEFLFTDAERDELDRRFPDDDYSDEDEEDGEEYSDDEEDEKEEKHE